MATKINGVYSAARLERGAATLAAAEVADVTFIKARVDAFAEAHRAYADAHRAVETAEAALRAGQEAVLARDAEQDAAVEELAWALVADRQPRRQPFKAFGLPSPSRVQRMGFAEEAKAVHQLVAAVQRNAALSDATRRAAQAAENAAQAIEKELPPMTKLEAAVQTARAERTVASDRWDAALTALKRGARIAADQGALSLYPALFGPPSRSKKKPVAPAPAPAGSGDVKPTPMQ